MLRGGTRTLAVLLDAAMSDLLDSIEQFLGYFAARLEDIARAQIGEKTNQFRKTLYVSLLDSLARTVSYPQQGNRDRFVSLIKNFADWREAERISVPHLAGLLSKLRSPEFCQLRAHALSELERWPQSTIVSLDRDLTFDDVKRKWPSQIAKPLEGLRLESVQHLHLFYAYRNSLVHDFREPGRGMEIRADGDPYYHSLECVDDGDITWELVYPVGFYHQVCETVLKNLKPYYEKNRIDPYACFTFGTFWIEELNR